VGLHAEQLKLFQDKLPKRPYATDDFTAGLRILPRQQAIQSKYIQPNHPVFRVWILIDVDRPGAGIDWYDRDAPAPNIVAINPANGHAHLFYGLEFPIYADPLKGSEKALRYAAAVEYGLVKLLDADFGYSGLMAKNPLHEHWMVHTFEQWLYDLEWLADYVDLPTYADRRRKMPEYGLGRNVTLFKRLRQWAYYEVKRYWGSAFDEFYNAVKVQAEERNTEFSTPMWRSEVRHIARSVSKWVWKHFTPEQFSRIQRERNRRRREQQREEKAARQQQVLQFMQDNPGASQSAAAKALGINQSTVSRYASAISDLAPRAALQRGGGS
jgi:hypothetical protein